MRGYRLSVIVWALVLTACGGHQSPQRPSRWLGRSPEPDSAQLQLMELNQHMAAEADAELLRYVEAQPETYALYHGGVWVHILEAGDDERKPYQLGQDCPLRMRVYTLGKTQRLLSDQQGTYRLSGDQLPVAVMEVVRELPPGTSARLVAPWYAAYGITGNQHVPPYQNVIIDLTIEE